MVTDDNIQVEMAHTGDFSKHHQNEFSDIANLLGCNKDKIITIVTSIDDFFHNFNVARMYSYISFRATPIFKFTHTTTQVVETLYILNGYRIYTRCQPSTNSLRICAEDKAYYVFLLCMVASMNCN